MTVCSPRDVAFYLSIRVFSIRRYDSNLTVVVCISLSCLVLHDLYLLQVSFTLCEGRCFISVLSLCCRGNRSYRINSKSKLGFQFQITC